MQTSTSIAVDIGNSAIKLALKTAEALNERSVVIEGDGWPETVVRWVQSLVVEQDVIWRIASVHAQATKKLTDHLHTITTATNVHLVTWHDIPMKPEVDDPDRLGIDRLITAYAASLHVEPPLIVVDAGSAITVDWVGDDRRFHGGVILPGLAMQFRSLAVGTASLPQIDWLSCRPKFPAKNTKDAIFSGVLTGATAGIDRLIIDYCQRAKVSVETVPVVLTGGDAPFLSPHLRHNHERIDNLVCRGLLRLQRSG